MFEKLGYSVTVIGYGEFTGNNLKTYDGIDYISLRPKSKSKIVRAIYRFASTDRRIKFLKNSCYDASVILLSDVGPNTFKKVEKYARDKNILLLHDSVEWFSPEQFSLGEKSVFYKECQKVNTRIVTKGWRVMAISTYLEEHFSKQCDKVVRVPVILDTKSTEFNTTPCQNGKVTFAYVGSPGRKDYLRNIIEGFAMLDSEEISRININVVGVNRDQLISVCGVEEACLNKLGDALAIHGRVPHSAAEDFVRNADYTLLLRDPNMRYAKAGFPTKIVESLACATPPICNISSDLGLYLRDGENAFIVKDMSAEELCITLKRVLTKSTDDMRKMRENARGTAEKCFDYRNYTDIFAELIKD